MAGEWTENSILNRLHQLIPDGSFPGPVAESKIAAAEKELGVWFPFSYRVFLKHFGAAWLRAPFEVAGLGPGRSTDAEPPLWSHVIDVTNQIRRVSRGLIPVEYVAISSDGGDYRFYLDTNHWDSRNECPVVVLGPGLDGVVIAGSFLEFLEQAAAGDPLAQFPKSAD